jgi:hypothetical protein
MFLSHKHIILTVSIIFSLLVPATMPAASASASVATPAIFDPPATSTATSALEHRTAYDLNVTLETETRRLVGTETIDWHNTTGRTQDSIYLRLYPNAEYYGDGDTSITQVLVDGVAAATPSGDDPTVLEIPLARSVGMGESATVSLAFTTVVPLGSSGSFGIFQLQLKTGTWMLADWYPIVAGWEESRGNWYLDRPSTFGDPTFSETASYRIALTAPGALDVSVTGDDTETSAAGNGLVTHTMTTGPVRDFAMTLLPTEGSTNEIVQSERALKGVSDGAAKEFVIRLTLPRVDSILGLNDAILDAVAVALPAYASWLGTLPADEIDITSASLDGATGVSWSGLIWLDVTSIVRDGVLSDQERMGLKFVVTHEIGHQWIGGLIGSNSNDHGFMTEGLTNALALEVLRGLEGADAASGYLQGYVAGGYAALVRDGRDAIADAPITSDMNGVIRGLVVYGKGGLGFEAIRQGLGDHPFRAAMRLYATRFRFEIATPEDLLHVFTVEELADGSAQALWTFWFERAETTLADVEAVFANAGT